MTIPTAPILASGRVHWIGTGMSTGSGLGLVCDGATTFLWGRTVEKAEGRLAALGLAGRAESRAFTYAALAAELTEGDVVVSMLPAAEHPELLRLAIEHRSHFVCSSYVSQGIAQQGAEAAAHGLIVLTEIGLDPGLDHLFAHELVRKAEAVTGGSGATVRFTSYCGSNPLVPNDFRYRFSWAPRGVLTALLTPARVIDGGAETVVTRPWEGVQARVVGGETFEVYPNRDSIPFIRSYNFPETWKVETFVRGTMRLDGWSDAWRSVFAELPNASDERITDLATELAESHPTSATDHDRVVMVVSLEVRMNDGGFWSGEYTFDAVGNGVEAATPRLVSVPLACGILEVTAGRVAPGLHQATDDPDTIERWLAYLSAKDITASYRGD